ncbi:fructosamine kinase family protein [Rathayibacter oskolensis]|nr:fructosamine kinase family protein [Rathayibacter oskolensis]WKK72042.1 fructosamine kinase family protein [Rathayibacter oskolensis]
MGALLRGAAGAAVPRGGGHRGNLRPADARVIERALEPIASGALDDGEPPARLHGDLWTGNVLWSPEGAVLIDPAAHGGHRETDLAMLALFGAPHLDEILRGYGEVHPLRDGAGSGWRCTSCTRSPCTRPDTVRPTDAR